MNKYLEQFEELLDEIIDNESGEFFDEIKQKMIERLNEIE